MVDIQITRAGEQGGRGRRLASAALAAALLALPGCTDPDTDVEPTTETAATPTEDSGTGEPTTEGEPTDDGSGGDPENPGSEPTVAPGPAKALAQARQRWSRSGPERYRLQYRDVCSGCRGPAWDLTVDGDEVTDVKQAGFGPPRTVAGLFAFIEDALQQDPATAEISYDPELGFPTRVFFDIDTQVADEELGVERVRVTPR